MNNFKLSIPDPCDENWNKMTPTQKGKFCGSCQKEVTDFSKMNKEEIRNFFIEKAGESTCGRFENRQLKEFNLSNSEQTKLIYKPWWIAAATLFLFANQGYSQGEPYVVHKKMEVKRIPVATEATRDDKTDKGEESINTDSLVYISGQVLDFNGDTVMFATVKIKDTNIGCVTDFDGNFKLLIPKNFQDTMTLQIRFVGYKSIDLSYSDLKQSRNVGIIKFDEADVMIMGYFIIEEEPSLPEKTKNVLLRMFR